MDEYDWKEKRIDQSRPPLRWIANLFGEIGGWAILRLSYAEEYDNKIAIKIYGFIFDRTFPLYQKYGTYYRIDWQIEEDI